MYEAFGSDAHISLAEMRWTAGNYIINKINKDIMTEQNKTDGDPIGMEAPEGVELSRQEENWMLMTTLQIPWKDANAIDDASDRAFLMDKVKEVQVFLKKQQEMEREQMMQMQAQQQAGQSNILTPQDIMQGK